MANLTSGYNLCGHILKEKIGEGTYGEVWKAIRERDNCLLAVKVLFSAHLSRSQVVKRFIQEFSLLKTLRHANIVEVYELLKDGEVLGMSMELVQGKPLSFAIKKRGCIPPQEAIKILQKMLHALSHAHQMGVLHRDIKPDNVLMTASAEVKLTDFGVAKVLHASGEAIRTRTGFSLGTPFYMAPEVIKGMREQMDHRLDIYSAGCVLYEMLTGNPPFFEALNLNTDNPEFYIQEAHVRLPPPDPRLVNSYVPDELARVCAVAMAKDPRERFRDCQHFITALQRVLDRMEKSRKQKQPAVSKGPVNTQLAAGNPTPILSVETVGSSSEKRGKIFWFWLIAFIVAAYLLKKL